MESSIPERTIGYVMTSWPSARAIFFTSVYAGITENNLNLGMSTVCFPLPYQIGMWQQSIMMSPNEDVAESFFSSPYVNINLMFTGPERT